VLSGCFSIATPLRLEACPALFSLTAPTSQQHQQQELAETGLAFDDVYVDSSNVTTVDIPDARRLHQVRFELASDEQLQLLSCPCNLRSAAMCQWPEADGP